MQIYQSIFFIKKIIEAFIVLCRKPSQYNCTGMCKANGVVVIDIDHDKKFQLKARNRQQIKITKKDSE